MPTQPNDPITGISNCCDGLLKREYFAAIAMQGYIAAGSTGMPEPNDIAKLALQTADALITALNEKS